jgi:hypothetical protein
VNQNKSAGREEKMQNEIKKQHHINPIAPGCIGTIGKDAARGREGGG